MRGRGRRRSTGADPTPWRISTGPTLLTTRGGWRYSRNSTKRSRSSPKARRRVFELHYYGDFSQAEIAQMLGVHRKQVSRLWLAATGRLAQWLEGIVCRYDEPGRDD